MSKDKRTSVYFDRDRNDFVGVNDIIEDLRRAFKDVDIEAELARMKIWLAGPKGKRRTGNIGFIMNWLKNSSPAKQATCEFYDLLESDTPLATVLTEYLEHLWKDREHILQLNTIKTLPKRKS